MSEVKTRPVRATNTQDKETFYREVKAGSFRVSSTLEEGGSQLLWYCCPCGCGSIAAITVGNRFKPTPVYGASWEWNGDEEAPTLQPSVHHIGHWHGWLRNGMWESV